MKHVMIADLKAKLSEYLRYVRQGHTVTVLDRNTPVARIVPITTRAALRVREPRRVYEKLGDIPLPPPVDLDVDVLEVLAEERQSHR
jgi:prevent-host-death family protein